MAIPNNPLFRFFSSFADGQRAGAPDWPFTRCAAVTPSDSVDLGFVTRALWIGGAGDVYVTALDTGTNVKFTVPAGTLLPGCITRVLATGTTATNIVALD